MEGRDDGERLAVERRHIDLGDCPRKGGTSMSVTLTLKSGKTRDFPEATGAFRRGPVMYVTKGNDEVWKGSSADVVEAIITHDTGEREIVPGGADAASSD